MPNLSQYLTPDQLALAKAAGTKLHRQRVSYATHDLYYEFGGPLPDVDPKLREAYRNLMRKARANWSGTVIDVVTERLEVVGVRIGDNPSADEAAWRLIWEGNNLNAIEDDVYTDAMVGGTSYVMVDPWPRRELEDGTKVPRITPEHPTQLATVADHEGDPPLCSIKIWKAAGGRLRMVLMYPEAIFKFQSKTVATVSIEPVWFVPGSTATPLEIGWGWADPTDAESWEPYRGPNDDEWPLDNPTGEVTAVRFTNRGRLRSGGRSELHGITSTQDRINQTLLDRMISQAFDSFRQKYVTGLDIPKDPDTGNPIEPFKSAIDRMWVIASPDAKVGTIEAGDIEPLLKAVESDVVELAALSRTPPHLLLGGTSVLPNAEALRSSEAGLLSKTERKQKTFGESWEEVFRIGSAVAGLEAVPEWSEVIWRSADRQTLAEMADAMVKLGSVLPLEAVWERAGATPEEIARWKVQMAASTFLVSAGADPNAPADEEIAGGVPINESLNGEGMAEDE